MKRYFIQHGYQLQSHPQKRLLGPGQYYVTESEDEIAELEALKAEGGCKEVADMVKPSLQPSGTQESTPKEKEKPQEPETLPEEDITVIPGVGAKLKGKLAETGVTTISQLKELIKSDEEKAKDLLGTHFEKIKDSLLKD